MIRSGTNTHTTQVSTISQNPDFDGYLLDYDVSVLKVSSPLTLGGLRKKEAAAGETAQVSGWGTTEDGGNHLSSDIQAVQVPVISRDDCNSAYHDDVTDRMICAGVTGKGFCVGDSGGAITIDNAQVGVVSWGYKCAKEGYPGVYSNIAALADFISESSNNEAKWF